MRRRPLGTNGSFSLALVAVSLLGSPAGCHSRATSGTRPLSQAELTENIASAFDRWARVEAPDSASNVCGARVPHTAEVRSGSIKLLSGSSPAGEGILIATVQAEPQAPATRCSAAYAFHYALSIIGAPGDEVVNTSLRDMRLFRPLSVGAGVDGTLQEGDLASTTGAYYDDYGLELEAGDSVSFTVQGRESLSSPGEALYAAGVVFHDNRAVSRLDGWEQTPPTHETFRASAGGLYFVRVFSAPGQSGKYRLQVSRASSSQQ